MNLSSLLTEAKSAAGRFIPGAVPAPVPFPASEPGGASAPLIWLVVYFCVIQGALWVAAGFFDLQSAQRFCRDSWQGVAAILAILIPALCAYRVLNKRTAAHVAIAQSAPPSTPALVAAANAKPEEKS